MTDAIKVDAAIYHSPLDLVSKLERQRFLDAASKVTSMTRQQRRMVKAVKRLVSRRSR